MARDFQKIFIALLIFLISCNRISSENFDEIYIDNGKDFIKINVKIADDNEEIMKGLMFREKLEENSGMLFIFDDEQYQTFWMKNTLIPLDIIFISEDFMVINIEGAESCKTEPCEFYYSKRNSRYVLEVNKGISEKYGIKPGDFVKFYLS